MLSPEVVLAGRKPDPARQLLGRQFGAAGPLADVVDHFVTRIRGNPAAFEGSPLAFCEDVLLHELGDDLVLLGDDRLEPGDLCVLGRLDRLGVAALLQVEHVGGVLPRARQA